VARDRELAARIVSGDGDALEVLVKAHQERLSRIVGRFFRRHEIVEEILQEVFVKAWQAMADYRGEMPLVHWLSRIAVNACYDHLRRKQARPETTVSQLVDEEEDFWERLGASDEGSGYWEREESRLLSEQLLSRLKPAERLVLTLMVLEDLSVAEVSKLTGWSQANVKIRAFRARGRMRGLLAEGGAPARDGRRKE
jgi:RNA polymerase sigma-70 factor (ECF subfamily)